MKKKKKKDGKDRVGNVKGGEGGETLEESAWSDATGARSSGRKRETKESATSRRKLRSKVEERERRKEKWQPVRRTLTHVSVSPTIVTGRLHERGGRGDGEPTIYIIVASSLATHTFVFIGRRRGGKATGGIFGPVRPEILR